MSQTSKLSFSVRALLFFVCLPALEARAICARGVASHANASDGFQLSAELAENPSSTWVAKTEFADAMGVVNADFSLSFSPLLLAVTKYKTADGWESALRRAAKRPEVNLVLRAIAGVCQEIARGLGNPSATGDLFLLMIGSLPAPRFEIFPKLEQLEQASPQQALVLYWEGMKAKEDWIGPVAKGFDEFRKFFASSDQFSLSVNLDAATGSNAVASAMYFPIPAFGSPEGLLAKLGAYLTAELDGRAVGGVLPVSQSAVDVIQRSSFLFVHLFLSELAAAGADRLAVLPSEYLWALSDFESQCVADGVFNAEGVVALMHANLLLSLPAENSAARSRSMALLTHRIFSGPHGSVTPLDLEIGARKHSLAVEFCAVPSADFGGPIISQYRPDSHGKALLPTHALVSVVNDADLSKKIREFIGGVEANLSILGHPTAIGIISPRRGE